MDDQLTGASTVGFTRGALLAFLRLSTKTGPFPRPMSVPAALEQVRAWLEQPTSVLLEPTAQHLQVLSGPLLDAGTGGNLTNDADPAALAIEHRGTVVTYDSDFGRFPGVSWSRPATG